MRRTGSVALLSLAMTLLGLKRGDYAPPESPMPPNTVLLSAMMRDLSAQPGFTQGIVNALDPAQPGHPKRGAALLAPPLLTELRNRMVGRDWSGLDRFPGWNMHRVSRAVEAVSPIAARNSTLERQSEVHPGAAMQAETAKREWLDVGPYALDKPHTISLADPPTNFAPLDVAALITELGHGVTRGDGPSPLAPEHAESQRLADVLNRLAANGMDDVKAFEVIRPWDAVGNEHQGGDKPVMSRWAPEEVIRDLQATGHTVTVTDTRYFANFAHMHFHGQDVMAPFWIDTGRTVPNSGGRPLLVPVSHAELEWQIRGPQVNADVSWYFGVDGKAEWRVMDTLDQPWVLKRAAHVYAGEQAIEATRLAALATVAYLHLHAAHPALPFGGYFTFGVCQDSVSAIEKKLTGEVTLFPNTADDTFLTDPRDPEFNAMMLAIPKDRDALRDDPARIFGSLPAAPDADGKFTAITIPGLADDLNASYAAFRAGTWQDDPMHPHTVRAVILTILSFGAAVGLGIFLAIKTRNFTERHPVQRKRD